MSESGATYIHGTAPAEQARLRVLNRLTNRQFIEWLPLRSGSVVLDVGSGLGVLAADVMASLPGVRVIGVERSWAQIEVAVRGGGAAFVQADAAGLPLADASFDLVYARYLLEHVGDPLRVLREMHRVVAPGGCVAVMENDISLARFDPPCPTFERVWDAFARLQVSLGGDPLIGRRLFRLLRSAGFSGIALSVQPEVHWSGSPDWGAWIENIAGNVESARKTLAARGGASIGEIDRALAELRELAGCGVGSATFVWNRAVCYRDART